MADDVVINKAEIIERCLRRVDKIYDKNPSNLHQDQLKQDAIVLNLERACQATVDLGMRLVRLKKLGIPKVSRDVFQFLEGAGLLESDISNELKNMIGFRNRAIHDYQALNMDIVQEIIEKKRNVFEKFIKISIKLTKSRS